MKKKVVFPKVKITLADMEAAEEREAERQKQLRRPQQKKMQQKRISHVELVNIISKQCDYPKYQVEDILRGLAVVAQEIIYSGKRFNIRGIGDIRGQEPYLREFKSPFDGNRHSVMTKRTIRISPDVYMENYLNDNHAAKDQQVLDKLLKEDYSSLNEETENQGEDDGTEMVD